MRKLNFFERLRMCILALAFEQKEAWSERLVKVKNRVKNRLKGDEFWFKLDILMLSIGILISCGVLYLWTCAYQEANEAYQEYYGHAIRSATWEQQTFEKTKDKFQTAYSLIPSNESVLGLPPISLHDHGDEIDNQGVHGYYFGIDIDQWHEYRAAIKSGELERLSFTFELPPDDSKTMAIDVDFMDEIEANGQISEYNELYWWQPVGSIFMGGDSSRCIDKIALAFARNVLRWSIYDSVCFAFFATVRLCALAMIVILAVLIWRLIDILTSAKKVKNHFYNINAE